MFDLVTELVDFICEVPARLQATRRLADMEAELADMEVEFDRIELETSASRRGALRAFRALREVQGTLQDAHAELRETNDAVAAAGITLTGTNAAIEDAIRDLVCLYVCHDALPASRAQYPDRRRGR